MEYLPPRRRHRQRQCDLEHSNRTSPAPSSKSQIDFNDGSDISDWDALATKDDGDIEYPVKQELEEESLDIVKDEVDTENS